MSKDLSRRISGEDRPRNDSRHRFLAAQRRSSRATDTGSSASANPGRTGAKVSILAFGCGRDRHEGVLLHYSMSLPVTTSVVAARSFVPLSVQEKERLRQELCPSREGLEHKVVGHLDGPTENPELFGV